MHSKRVTIKDVAKLSGYSTGTVSRFLSNTGYVSDEARDKIGDAIDQLHYLPSSAARSMTSNRAKIIGVAVPEINNPFLADLVVKIEDHLMSFGYSVMFSNIKYDKARMSNFIDDLIMRSAEGLVLISLALRVFGLVDKVKNNLHAVSLGDRVEEFSSVTLTSYDSAAALTQYMIDMGHRDIAFVGFHPNSQETMERLQGYKGTLEKNDLPIRPEYMIANTGRARETEELIQLDNPPTAIININDFNAFHCYNAIHQRGLKVGKDISVGSFDDTMMAKILSPSLTTVSANPSLMAEEGVNLLMRDINSDKKEKPREIVLQTSLIVRDSVGRI